jgi:hypothetical protein
VSSNYLIRGILASLPTGTPERHWRLILALETVTPDSDGWRTIGMNLLGEHARLSQPALRKARDELRDAQRIDYKRTGGGRWVIWWWQILIPPMSANVKHRVSPTRPVQDETPGAQDETPGAQDETPNSLTSDDAPKGFKGSNSALTTGKPTAQTILAAFIDWDRGNGGQLTRRTTGQLAKHIAALLAEGIDDKHIRQGLAGWRAKGQHPSTLDSFVNAAMNGRGAPRRRGDLDWDAQLTEARQRDAAKSIRGELE